MNGSNRPPSRSITRSTPSAATRTDRRFQKQADVDAGADVGGGQQPAAAGQPDGGEFVRPDDHLADRPEPLGVVGHADRQRGVFGQGDALGDASAPWRIAAVALPSSLTPSIGP